MSNTKRFSVCIPGDPPVQVLATNSLQLALAVSTADEVVYDWTTGKIVNP